VSALIGPLTVVAAVGSGLMAGLFFAFSVAIMPAFARVPAPAGLAAMQAINTVIVRPLFLVVFVGTALVSATSAVLAPDPLRLTGAACYLIGAIGVTAVVNVPMNNALDRLAPDDAEAARTWQGYRSRWTGWNHVRAVACAAAVIAFVIAA
jgi:uncharacterized membrane protein